MAPALTKILKNGHGIHLSSPPASVRVDPDGRSSCSIELEPPNRSLDSGSLQTMWQDLSSLCSLDSSLTSSLPDASANPEFSPCLQASVSQCEMESLVWLLSLDKDQRGSHQVGSVSPGGPGMFLVPVSEHNSQEVCVQHEQRAAPERGPDGGDVDHSFPSLTSVCPSYSSREIDAQGSASLFANPAPLTQEELPRMGYPSRASQQPCAGRVDLDQPAFKAVLQEAVKDQLSRQTGLQDRAWRLQKRLQGLVGEQAVQHCIQQLDGLKRHPEHGKVFLNSLDSTPPNLAPQQVSNKPHLSWQESSIDLSFFTDVSEFSHSSQLVLRELQEALDSEATASSSSDEESQEDRIGGKVSHIRSSSSCEKQWLEERVELGSRWSWLQLRLAELDEQIQQQVQVYKHMRSNRVGVLLADSHPMTERQIQKTLMRELSGLTCTASDADTEPCSPTRLLHNIERQSAHLNQIVNSLMPPLSFSPLSKQPYTQKGKRAFTRGQRGDYLLLPESSKRRRLTARSLFKADLSCVCARTRPLVSYHKPKLFTLNSHNPNSLLDFQSITSSFSSLSPSSCSCWSSCDPVNLCPNPDCGSSTALSSNRSRSSITLSSPTQDISVCHNFQRVKGREQWYLKPLVYGFLPFSPLKEKRYNSTPLHHSRNYKQHARHRKNRLLGLSPIRLVGSVRSQGSTAIPKRRKRGNIHRGVEDEKDVLYQPYNPEENTYNVPEESYTSVPRKQASQGFVHKRQGARVYNINNVILPASLGKVETLQYKEIVTPRWRIVDTESLLKLETPKKHENGEEKTEDLSDEVFAQRHMALEQKEKSSWPHWGKTKSFMLSTSSGSGLSGSGGGTSTSGEESSVESSFAQLDSDEQPKSEEWLPQTHWDPRVFPLDKAEETALLSDVVLKVQSEWTEPFGDSSSKNSKPQHSPTQWFGATLPPAGQDEAFTSSGI